MKVKVKSDKVVLIGAYCEQCGTELIWTGNVLLVGPIRWEHKCGGCGCTEMLDQQYPSYALVSDQFNREEYK